MPLRVLFAAHVEGRVGHGGVRGGRRMAHHVYTAAVDLVRRVNHHLSAGGGIQSNGLRGLAWTGGQVFRRLPFGQGERSCEGLCRAPRAAANAHGP